MARQFPPAVEQWRGLVSKYFPPNMVDKALWVIQYETGGRNITQQPTGPGTGLFQIEHGGQHEGRPSQKQLLDPEFNVRMAAEMASRDWNRWTDWGEDTLSNGKTGVKFGALGNHPFPDKTGPAQPMAPPPAPPPPPVPPPEAPPAPEGGGGGGGIFGIAPPNLPDIPVPGLPNINIPDLTPNLPPLPGIGGVPPIPGLAPGVAGAAPMPGGPAEGADLAPAGPVQGPGGRTFAETTGNEYVNPEEMMWYRAMAQGLPYQPGQVVAAPGTQLAPWMIPQGQLGALPAPGTSADPFAGILPPDPFAPGGGGAVADRPYLAPPGGQPAMMQAAFNPAQPAQMQFAEGSVGPGPGGTAGPAQPAQQPAPGGAPVTQAPVGGGGGANPMDLPPWARQIGGGIAEGTDPASGTTYRWQYNPVAGIDPTTGTPVPAGWKPYGTPSGGGGAGGQANIRVNPATGKAYRVNDQGQVIGEVSEFEQPPDVKAQPKTAMQLLTEQFSQAMGALNGPGAAAGPGGVPTAAGPAVAANAKGPGQRTFEETTGKPYISAEERTWYLSELAKRNAGGVPRPPGQPLPTEPQAFYGVDNAGNTQFAGQRVATPGGGTRDINANSIYQTLGSWGAKPTGDLQKDAAEAAQLELRRGMMQQLFAGQDPAIIQRGIDAMTGGASTSYVPTPQMAEQFQATVSKSPTQGKGVKLDPTQLEAFGAVKPRDYDILYPGISGFQEGGSVTAGVDPLEELRRQLQLGPAAGQSQAVSQDNTPTRVMDTNIGGALPVGSIGEDWEGNPLYEPTRRAGSSAGGRGGLGVPRPRRDPYASGMSAPGVPFKWPGAPLAMRAISSQQQFSDELTNRLLAAERDRLLRTGRWQEAARIQFANSHFPSAKPAAMPGMPGMEEIPGMQGGGSVYGGMGGMPPVTPAPAGAQMVTSDPILGVNMNTQQPEFMVGEAGPEQLSINPMGGGMGGGGMPGMAPGMFPPAPMPQMGGMPPAISEFGRAMETIMGMRGRTRGRPVQPAGSMLGRVGGLGGGGY